jgi:NAD(P)-dependent dehydrogenase (short-subunit alcohol dehydrogenase family)
MELSDSLVRSLRTLGRSESHPTQCCLAGCEPQWLNARQRRRPTGAASASVWRERAAIYPQNRVLEPREVAQVIAFLCS